MEPEIDSLVQHQQYCTRTLYQKCNAKTITLERPVPWKSGPPEARQSSINKLDSHLEFQPSGIFVCICTCFLLLLSSALFVKKDGGTQRESESECLRHSHKETDSC